MKKILFFFVLSSLTIQFSNAQIIITKAGNNTSGYSGDGGLATSASFDKPACVAIDLAGNIYISDTYNHVIRKVNTSGIISTFAGTGTAGFSGNGGPATSAKLSYPTGIAIDSEGNVYFSEPTNSVIRKVNIAGIISTFAGSGIPGYSGDGGPATSAKLFYPVGVAIDSTGNVYIADYYNNVIRKVNSLGIISTIAGNNVLGYSGDGGLATSANLSGPFDITLDASGNIYFSELNNDVVRIVNPSGIISTFAGTGVSGFSGDGGPATSAQLSDPSGLAIDIVGNMYIAEGSNQDIRMVNTAGIMSTFAGTGIIGYSGDGGPALLAQFNGPEGIDFDAAGNLYIADINNNVIREVGGCMPIIPEICMVTVDSLSQNNIIYWDNSSYTADTFFIYRDTSNNNYALIGKVPSDSLSMFIDTARTLYSANGDPNASSWRYKIAYRDTCGGNNIMSDLSPYHQTLFMISSDAIFAWTQYQIEGQIQPVPSLENYLFERDNYSTENYDTIQTLSASSTFYMDTQYSAFPNASWRVKTKWSISCTPSSIDNKNIKAAGKTAKSSHSNSYRSSNSINENLFGNNMISVYPNPSNGKFEVKSENYTVKTVEVYNVFGEILYSEHINLQKSIIINPNLSDGLYLVKIISDEGISIKKIVIAK